MTQGKNQGEIGQKGKSCKSRGNVFCYFDEQVTQEQMEIQNESPSSPLLRELQPWVLVMWEITMAGLGVSSSGSYIHTEAHRDLWVVVVGCWDTRH